MNLDPIPLLVSWGTPLSLPPAFIFLAGTNVRAKNTIKI